MLRGSIDPKETPVYEYVKFIGNFKSLNNGMLLVTLISILQLHEYKYIIKLCMPILFYVEGVYSKFHQIIHLTMLFFFP